MKAAAAELAITPAALGQRIKSLENYLGFDLLVRGRSGIRPTRELQAAIAHLSAGFRELDTVSHLLNFQRVHEIHITADSDWVDLWLHPRLQRFKDDNPNILFCINGIGDVPVRLGDTDCEIWFGAKQNGDVADLLFHDYLLPVSSPENTLRISRQPDGEMLEGFPLLHLDCYTAAAGAIGWTDWINRYGQRKTAPDRGIRYRKIMQALEAVYANAGLLVCGLALVGQQIKDGSLSLPFPNEQGVWSTHAYRVGFSQAAIRRKPVAQFRDWLLEEAAKTERELQRLTGSARGDKRRISRRN